MSSANAGPKRKLSWVVRHKILSLALLVMAAVALDNMGSDTDPSEASSKPAATASASPTPTQGPERDSEPAGEASGKQAKNRTKESSQSEAVKHLAQAANPAKPRARTYLVTYVVDGDTIELGNGERVRIVGIDTPERGECGYDQATAQMERLVLGKRVRLTISDEDRDRYGRLLRYVNVGKLDAGLRQIAAGLAIARYDSRDGYGYHPRENRYIAVDKATPNKRCPRPKPAPVQEQPIGTNSGAGCEPGYDPCVPPYPPDVDCSDVDGPILVTGSDPHGLDGEGDGIACEP